MIFGIGIDIIEINRIKKAVVKHINFLDKYFTTKELAYFNSKKNNYESISGYFCAKEAVAKALGTGFHNFRLKDIEVLKDEYNKPFVVLHNNAKIIADQHEIEHIHLSISHSIEYAVANAVATIKSKG